IPALDDGDAVHSVPGPDAPVLVRRADGSAQLLGRGAPVDVDAAAEDVLALSADGTRLIRAADGRTVVSRVGDGALGEGVEVAGIPLALSEDLLVVRECEEDDAEASTLSGYDLAAGGQPQWTLTAPGTGQARGIDPAGVEVAARPDAAPGLLDAV